MTSAKPFYDAATYPAGESVGFLVRQLRMSFTHCIDRTMARYDLTDAQWGPLLLIARGRARTAAALLRDRTGGNPFFLTELCNDLESRGGLAALGSHQTVPASIGDAITRRCHRSLAPRRGLVRPPRRR